MQIYGLTSFINHNKDSNVNILNTGWGDYTPQPFGKEIGVRVIKASRNIKAGEELFYDYAKGC